MTEITLKPCPFCGGSDIFLDDFDAGYGRSKPNWNIGCNSNPCRFEGGFGGFSERAEAIAAWNTRQAEAKVEGLLADIVSEADFLLRRLEEAERDFTDSDGTREYFGHCCPPKARLRKLIDAHLSPNPHTDEGAE